MRTCHKRHDFDCTGGMCYSAPMKEITVNAEWYPDAGAWVATSEDIRGLVAQAPDLETLKRKVLPMIEDLVELNKVPIDFPDVPIHFISKETNALRLKSVA
jgi:Domain of unknown function (DUF1902)